MLKITLQVLSSLHQLPTGCHCLYRTERLLLNSVMLCFVQPATYLFLFSSQQTPLPTAFPCLQRRKHKSLPKTLIKHCHGHIHMKQHRNRTAAEPAYCTCNSVTSKLPRLVMSKEMSKEKTSSIWCSSLIYILKNLGMYKPMNKNGCRLMGALYCGVELYWDSPKIKSLPPARECGAEHIKRACL